MAEEGGTRSGVGTYLRVRHVMAPPPALIDRRGGSAGVARREGRNLGARDAVGETHLKFHPVPRPTMGKDTFWYPRALQAPAILTLGISRHEAAAASLGNVGEGLTILTGRGIPSQYPI